MNWYEMYMNNLANISTIDKLVKAGEMTEAEKEKMVSDRLGKYGY